MSVIFISHSSKDNETAKHVVSWLRGRDLESIFLDFDPDLGIPAGRHWEQELYQKLRVCRAVIILCSEHSTASEWCFAEITLARSLGKDLFPIKIRPCSVPEILTDRQVIDLTNNPEDGYKRLWNGLIRSGLDPKDYFRWDPKRPPYPGLLAFEEEDAAVFFGRDESIRDGLDKLNQLRRYHQVQRLLMFLGASGSGKSSLVRAGIVPRLRRDPDTWLVVNPFRPRQQPFEELSISLSEAFGRYGEPRDRRIIEASLNQATDEMPADGNILVQLARDLGIAAGKRDAIVVLVIDQFEELLGAGESSQNEQFLRLLRAALEAPHENPLAVIGTLRSDFLGDFQKHPALLGLRFAESMVGPLGVDGYVKVIEGPAEVAGLRLEPGLTELMVKDTESEDALPLLAFTLRELWERYGHLDGDLTIEEYQDRLGGLLGSVQRAADGVMNAEPLSEGQRNDLRHAFLAMTRINEEGQYARRAVRWDDLPPASYPILQRFVEARLLVSGKEDGTLEVAHETLLRHWPLLKGWLGESREFLLWRRRLQAAYSEYERSHTLLRDAPLTEAERWMEERPSDLTPAQASFIRESIKMQEQERIAGQRLRRRIVSGLSIGLGVALILVLLAGWQWRGAEIQRHIALSRQLTAQSIALSSQGDLDRALLLSQEALRVSESTKAHYESRSGLLTAHQSNPGLTTFLRGHDDQVGGIAFSPDGKMLASGSFDKTIILWDTQTLQPIGEPLRAHSKRVWNVAFSPDGRILASAGDDGSVILRDPQSHRQIGEPIKMPGNSGVSSIAFSSDGRTLASGSYNGLVILWDLGSRQRIGEPLRGYKKDVSGAGISVAFSRDGKTLAGGYDDGRVILWDTESRQRIVEFVRGHSERVFGVAFSPDGRMLASGGGDGRVVLWDLQSLQSGQKIGRPLKGHDTAVFSLAFSPDGSMLASGDAGGTVILWDLQTHQRVRELRGHDTRVYRIAFNPISGNLATASADETVILWDLQIHQRIGELLRRHNARVSSVAFNRDGTMLASGDAAGTVILWDTQTHQRVGEPLWAHDGQVNSVAFDPDGRMLASGGAGGSVFLWDLQSLQSGQKIGKPLKGHDTQVFSVAFSPDGSMLASGGDSGKVILWDLQTYQLIGQPLKIPGDSVVSSIAFRPDGKVLATGDGRRLTTGSAGTVILWDLQNRQQIGEPLWSARVSSVAFRPDGRMGVSGSVDGTVILWNPQTREQIREPLRHKARVYGIAISPDGRMLASGGGNGRVVLWDLQTHQRSGELRGHDTEVFSLAFSPDGSMLASGDAGGTVILWDMDIKSWKTRACRIAGRNLTPSEWTQYLGDEPYHKTCPNLPEGR